MKFNKIIPNHSKMYMKSAQIAESILIKEQPALATHLTGVMTYDTVR